jgi:hypothetical protein
VTYPDKRDWGPRLGFAYSPFPKTVIRAAAGMYYALLPENEDQFRGVLNPPFFFTGSIYNSNPASYTLDKLFPAIASTTWSPCTIVPHDRTPRVGQYNINIQHEFKGGILAEIGYVGDQGRKINRRFNSNIADPGPEPLAERRPYQGWSDILTSSNSAITNYNGLNAQLTKPMSRGMMLIAAYTYGKELNTADQDEYTHRDTSKGIFKDMYGPSEFDQRQRLTLSYIYSLPVGRGQHLLGNVSGPANKVVSGWQLAGTTTFASGQPVTADDNWAGWGNIGGRRVDPAICVGPLNNSTLRNNIRKNPTLGPYFNIQNALEPAYGTMGNCGRGMVFGPGLNNFNWALMKDTRVTERVTVQFRAEAFNIWNHAQFWSLDYGYADPHYGYITSARAPRDVQFAMKLIF